MWRKLRLWDAHWILNIFAVGTPLLVNI
jgi:hypothetical protein